MQIHFKFIVLACFFALFLQTNGLFAQQQHEIGIRLSNVDQFDFVYKKQKAENKWMRYRLAATNINLVGVDDETSFSFSFAAGIGLENRKSINEKLYFIHGFEPTFSFAFVDQGDSNLTSLQPGLGYVLGFQLDFSEQFYLSVEAVPALNFTYTINDDADNLWALNAGFGTRAVALTAAYRFSSGD